MYVPSWPDIPQISAFLISSKNPVIFGSAHEPVPQLALLHS